MKRISSLLAILSLAGCAGTGTQVAAPTTGSTAAGPETAALNAPVTSPRYKVADADETTDIVVRYKAGHEMRSFSKGRSTRRLELERTEVIKTDSAAERDALLAELKADAGVEFAEPDVKMHAFYTPNDPSYSRQWDMPKIGMSTAWDVTKGASTVKVAVIDTGVDYNHPDLAGKVIKGRDFANNDADPMDDQGHGTHVAGTIAALTGNGVGVTGVAPNCQILAVKVLGGDGSGSTSGIADGITYAVAQGAQVINLSLGGPQSSSVLKTAVDNAVAKGVVVIVAAGNDSATIANYPAAYPNSISVGSSGTTDTRDSYSNYHASVAIAAPGSNILSTTKGGGYGNMSGTSMASPHVAGAAALLKSQHPTWTVAQVRQALVSTGDAVSGFSTNPAVKRMNVAKALAYGGTTAPAPTPAPTVSPAPTTGDNNAPVMSNVSATVGSTTATFKWTTNEPSDTQAEIGLTNNPTSRTAYQAALVTAHQASVQYLAKGTRYYFRLRSKDKAGNLKISPVYSFVTRR